MGVKQIWDGHDLPPIGCDVLIRFASQKQPARVTVAGYSTTWSAERRAFRINVKVRDGEHENERLLQDVYPLDWRGEMPTGLEGRFKSGSERV